MWMKWRVSQSLSCVDASLLRVARVLAVRVGELQAQLSSVP